MFKELLPVIENRALTITVAHLGDAKIRLCVVPHSKEKDTDINRKVAHHKDVPKISEEAIKALTTPLAIEGTEEELDAELPQQLVTYATAHRTLQDGIAAATQKLTAALAVIEEREHNKSKAKAFPPAKKGEGGNGAAKEDGKSPADATLPLSWCVPAPAAVSTNDSADAEVGAQE